MAKGRITLKARDGYVYTNGTDYAKIAHLAIGVDPNTYYEITEEEYNKILEEQEKLTLQQLEENIE